jgi:hypothetical protein
MAQVWHILYQRAANNRSGFYLDTQVLHEAVGLFKKAKSDDFFKSLRYLMVSNSRTISWEITSWFLNPSLVLKIFQASWFNTRTETIDSVEKVAIFFLPTISTHFAPSRGISCYSLVKICKFYMKETKP